MKVLVSGALGAFGGALGFAVLLNAPRRTLLPISLTSLAGYAVYLLLYPIGGYGMLASYFLSTLVLSIICEIEARVMRMPSTVFLLCALVPLVPGYDFYNAMLALVENDGMHAAVSMMRAVQVVAAIAVGAAASSSCVRMLMGIGRRRI